jgi:hypothetical protein
MKINRVELDKIHEVLKNFPDVNDIEIVRDGSSGIGYILSIKFDQAVNGVDAVVEIEITGVENW